jgi:hypothetical protein
MRSSVIHHKKLMAGAAAVVMAVALGCSNDAPTPVSPTGADPGGSGAGPAGETLKATAPSPLSPISNQQPDTLVLVAGKSNPSYAVGTPPTYAYEFEVRNSGGTATVCPAITVPGGSGSSVSFTPTCTLTFDQQYSWRVRAVFAGAVGPWSSNATFRAPAGGYVRDSEIFDPLTNSRTAGAINGPVEFISGTGVRLVGHDSHITYVLPTTLEAGEMSMMILNADEGSPGDKSKVFAMQEGPDVNDITDDDYRFTAELRGRNYGAPGSIAFRIIAGDGESRDGERLQHNFDSSRWYFWRFTWQTGNARLVVKEDGPSGSTIYDMTPNGGTGTHAYRPNPHYVHIGSPIGRAGPIDATMPGIIIKNLWVSARPRPAFPGE